MGLCVPAPFLPRFAKRTLTIPVDFNLTTKMQHREKAPTASPQKGKGKGNFLDNSLWYSTLRDSTSSPALKASSTRSSPTIPQTPQFQHICQHPLPKSTAKKECKEMEYYRNHPFLARPVKMNPLLPLSLQNTKALTGPTKWKLTTPVGFNLQTDKQGAFSHDCHNKAHGQEKSSFKACPMPGFEGNNCVTPMPGLLPSGLRQTTTPEPFHFQTTSRGAAYTPESVQAAKKPTGKSATGQNMIPLGASGLVNSRQGQCQILFPQQSKFHLQRERRRKHLLKTN